MTTLPPPDPAAQTPDPAAQAPDPAAQAPDPAAQAPDPAAQAPGASASARPPVPDASGPPPQAVPARPHEADGRWRRVHPLTPVVKSWQVFVVILVFIGQDWGQAAARGEHGLLPTDGVGSGFLAGGISVAVLLLLLGLGFAVLSWRMTRYRVTEDALELHHGVISRRQRRARLDRLQAVDVVQPLLARVVGMAQLNVEVAGGSDSKIQIAYLTYDQAQELRNHLLARAAGVRYDTEQRAPEAPEHQVLEVPVERLMRSLALSSATVTLVLVVVGLAVAVVMSRSAAPVAAMIPTLLMFVSLVWQRFARGFGFRAATGPDGLRLRHGLLEHRAQTVPPGRVQAVRMSQPLLWRKAGWWRVQVNVAGYGRRPDSRQDTESVLLPVGTRDEAMAVVSFVLPELGVAPPDDARSVVAAAMTGAGPGQGFVTSPRSARWLDPLAWRRNGYRVTDHALLIRRGRLHRHVELVPHARTQSCGVRQALLQRPLGLASFHLHSTPGPISPVVPHLSTADAARLLAEQADRARYARAAAGPELWMGIPPTPGTTGAGQGRDA